ncbi:MAG TPA: C45 family peptidase [Azospirillaceae bacterium]|nr:C45 family peptidase [Azospirillaceae bacterium]
MSPFPLIDVAGGPEERGERYGRLAADRIALALDLYREEFARKGIGWAEAHALADRFLERIADYDPELTREMAAIAAGAGQTLSAVVLINARTELMFWKLRAPSPSGAGEECTSAIVLPEASRDGRLLHAQNWDWQPQCAETTVVLRIRGADGVPSILTCAEAGQLARHGLNAAGIAITANGLHSDQDYGRFGIPNPLIRRRMLASTSLARAMFVLNNAPRAFSHHLGISHADGEAFGIEATPDDLFVLEPRDGLLVHANHFVSPVAQLKVRDLNIARTPETLYRQGRVEKSLRAARGGVDMDALKAALADRWGSPDAVCRSPAERPGGMVSATVYTLVMDAGAGRLWLAPRPYEDGAEFTEYRLED